MATKPKKTVKKPSYEPLTISQPPSWLAAFREQARRLDMDLSEWFGWVAKANLDADLKAGLPERTTRGRPRKHSDE